MPGSEDEFVVLLEAGSPFEVQLAAGALEDAGIPCVTDADTPADEFAMSRRLLGRGIRLLVPAARREEAARFLERLREASPDDLAGTDEGPPEPAEAGPGFGPWSAVWLVLVLGLLALGLVKTCNPPG